MWICHADCSALVPAVLVWAPSSAVGVWRCVIVDPNAKLRTGKSTRRCVYRGASSEEYHHSRIDSSVVSVLYKAKGLPPPPLPAFRPNCGGQYPPASMAVIVCTVYWCVRTERLLIHIAAVSCCMWLLWCSKERPGAVLPHVLSLACPST
jgi:hypothetical protein